MEDTCKITGNPDMYGIGIRLGFYLSWLGRALAKWIAPLEVYNMKITGFFYIVATVIAILIRLNKTPRMEIVEIYVAQLLTIGQQIVKIPFVLISISIEASRGDIFVPRRTWDEELNYTDKLTRDVADLAYTGILVFQLWFWASKVKQLESANCQQIGFLFVQTSLDSTALRVTNLVFISVLLVFHGGPLPKRILQMLKLVKSNPPDREARRNIDPLKLDFDGIWELIIDFAPISTIIAATECTIWWNNIPNVNDIDSVGQLIPITIGVCSMVRILYRTRYMRDQPIDDGV